MASCADALSCAAALLVALSSCGGAPSPEPQSATDPEPTERAQTARGAPAGPSIESEVGALDERKVKETFDRVSSSVNACFRKGAGRLPYLAGQARAQVRVAPDGSARAALLIDSTLGDRTTEDCILGVLKGTPWPKPVGGHEGVAENTYTFEAGDERPPVEWSSEQLGKPLKHAWPALTKCRAKSGAGSVKVTVYVETNGKPLAVGASAADDKGEAAIPCIVDTLKSVTFPSPGSYASKATFAVE